MFMAKMLEAKMFMAKKLTAKRLDTYVSYDMKIVLFDMFVNRLIDAAPSFTRGYCHRSPVREGVVAG